MLLQLRLTPYRLPLRRPWRTAHGIRHAREGWLVRASCEGCHGYGDCAPLPEAGTETPTAAAARLSIWLRDLSRSTLKTQLEVLEGATPSATPAADAALEVALLDLSARLCGLSLRESLINGLDCVALSLSKSLAMLNKPEQSASRHQGLVSGPELKTDGLRTSGLKPNLEIELNAALGTVANVPPAVLEQALNQALTEGFRVLKIKVGVAPIDRELAAIQRLCARLPIGARLRLDANRAWSLTTARKLLDDLLPVANLIESLEEPCADATDAQLRALQARTPIALAFDESLPMRGWPLDPERLPLRRLVLKPAVIGGLRPTLALARRAQAVGLEVVITSLIESAAGLWSSAQLAAATGSPLAHGLATSDWLAVDLGAAPVIKVGRMRLPDRPGSGFLPASWEAPGETTGEITDPTDRPRRADADAID